MRNRTSKVRTSAKATALGIEGAHYERAPKGFRLNRLTAILGLLALLAHCEIAHGMATEQIGPASDRHPTSAQPGSQYR